MFGRLLAELELLTAIGILSSALAAYFAWQTYRRKPKLRITLLEESLKRLRSYRGGGGYFGGQVILRVENPGKIAANNVVGWIRFDREYLVPRVSGEGCSMNQDNTVTVRTPSLSPNPSKEDDGSLLQVGKEFKIRVETKQSGQTRIHYRFVCDEGVHVESVLPTVVPAFGDYSEEKLIAFLRAIHNEPRAFTKANDLAAHLRSIGQDIGLSALDLSTMFRDILACSYIVTGKLDEASEHLLAVTLDGERFDVPQRLELSIRGYFLLNDHDQP